MCFERLKKKGLVRVFLLDLNRDGVFLSENIVLENMRR